MTIIEEIKGILAISMQPGSEMNIPTFKSAIDTHIAKLVGLKIYDATSTSTVDLDELFLDAREAFDEADLLSGLVYFDVMLRHFYCETQKSPVDFRSLAEKYETFVSDIETFIDNVEVINRKINPESGADIPEDITDIMVKLGTYAVWFPLFKHYVDLITTLEESLENDAVTAYAERESVAATLPVLAEPKAVKRVFSDLRASRTSLDTQTTDLQSALERWNAPNNSFSNLSQAQLLSRSLPAGLDRAGTASTLTATTSTSSGGSAHLSYPALGPSPANLE